MEHIFLAIIRKCKVIFSQQFPHLYISDTQMVLFLAVKLEVMCLLGQKLSLESVSLQFLVSHVLLDGRHKMRMEGRISCLKIQ
jgi:hypothetical protein